MRDAEVPSGCVRQLAALAIQAQSKLSLSNLLQLVRATDQLFLGPRVAFCHATPSSLCDEFYAHRLLHHRFLTGQLSVASIPLGHLHVSAIQAGDQDPLPCRVDVEVSRRADFAITGAGNVPDRRRTVSVHLEDRDAVMPAIRHQHVPVIGVDQHFGR